MHVGVYACVYVCVCVGWCVCVYVCVQHDKDVVVLFQTVARPKYSGLPRLCVLHIPVLQIPTGHHREVGVAFHSIFPGHHREVGVCISQYTPRSPQSGG